MNLVVMLDMIGVELDGVESKGFEPKGFELCSIGERSFKPLKRQICKKVQQP